MTRHCALGDGRSWTDLVTNSGELTGPEVGDDLDWRGGEGELPVWTLSTFIHEGTHHWSFLSPVGLSLAKLKFDAWKYACRIQDDGATKKRLAGLTEAWLRYEVAVAVLRPLAEGLALFAEFDATRRRAHLTSAEPIAWAEQLSDHVFDLPYEGDIRKLPDHDFGLLLHKGLIRAMRLSDDAVQRRVNLFGQPLHTSAGGYLPGYLALRAAWVAAGQAGENEGLWRESDLFLRHVRATTYGDLGLVRALLAGGDAANGSLDRILTRVAHQLDELTWTRLGHLHNTMAAWSLSAAGNEFLDPPADIYLHLEPDAKAGLKLLRKMLTAAAAPTGDNPLDKLMSLVIGCRRFLILGGTDVDVAMTGGLCYVSRDGQLLYTTDQYPEFLEGKGGRARIRAFIPVLGGDYRGSFVSAGVDLIHVDLSGRPENIEKDLHLFPDEFAELVSLWNMGSVYDAVLDDVVATHGIAAQTTDLRDRLAHATEEVYRSRALRLLPPELAAAPVADRLATEGLLPLAGYDRTILEGLALLGLACSIDPRERSVAAAFRSAGLDLSTLLAWIDARSAEGAFPPVFRYGSTSLMPSL
jgi:hypothetical protein